MVHQFTEESLNSFGIRLYFDEVMVHINGIDPDITFIHVQFVVGDDKPVGLQAGSKPNNDAIRTNFNITSIGAIVQNEQIVNIDTGLCNKKFWGADTAHGKTLFYRDGFAYGIVNFFGDCFIVVGDVQKHI